MLGETNWFGLVWCLPDLDTSAYRQSLMTWRDRTGGNGQRSIGGDFELFTSIFKGWGWEIFKNFEIQNFDFACN